MKKRLLFSVLCVLLVVLNTSVASSQSIESPALVSSSTFFNPDGFVSIAKGEKSKDVIIEIKEETLKLKLQIGGIVKSGTFTFDIYDPSGRNRADMILMNGKQGELLTIVDDLPGKDNEALTTNQGSRKVNQIPTSDKKELKGQFHKIYENPLPGKWIVKVRSKNCDGKFKIYHIVTMKKQ